MSISYEIHAQRSGKWWAINSPDLDGLYTQCRQLAQVEETARDAASLLTEIPEQDIALKVVVKEPDNVRVLIDDLKEIGKQADLIENKKRASQQETVNTLIKLGYSYRDIAALVGISYQRVGAIAKT